MNSEADSQSDVEPANVPKVIPRPERPWLGSAALLAGGVLIFVVMMIGRAVTLWWQGDVNGLGETLAIGFLLVFGLAAFLSVWWVCNKIEHRFRPYNPVQAKSPGLLKELKGCLVTSIPLPIVVAIVVVSGRWHQRQQQGPPFQGATDAEKRMIWMSPEVFQERLRKQEATLQYWNIAVANLHAVRFEPPSGRESAEKYYEHMFQQLRLQTDAARSASTANVDPELVQMVTRHLTVEDQFLQLRQKLDEIMRDQQIPAPKDTVDQRMAMTQSLLGILQAHPDVLEKMPPGPERDWIEKGLELEHLRQVQFREIEIMQAVLRERYKGITFPLPTISP